MKMTVMWDLQSQINKRLTFTLLFGRFLYFILIFFLIKFYGEQLTKDCYN